MEDLQLQATMTLALSKQKAVGLNLVLSYLSLIVSFWPHHDLFLTL
ncbi:hypothetical protein NC652_007050 [Populus alba x Populus x berolinensis]|nr:hypothetical protein NC652_007050 [Populus alba x Populus x berolinensis]